MPRTLILAIIGILVAGLGVTGWRALSSAPPPPNPVAPPPVQVQMVTLLVAYRDVPAGAFLRPSDISTVSVAASIASPRTWKDTPANRSALSGALVRRPIPHDTPFEPSELLLTGDHSFLASLLTPGMRGYTIRHDQILSGSELIWPGDQIDLILTQQTPGLQPLDSRISAETVLSGLRVLAVDRQLVQPALPDDKETARSNPGAGTVTVEVSPSDAEKLAIALRLGSVALSVRPATRLSVGDHPVDEMPQTHQPGTTWAGAVMHSLDQIPSPPPAVSLRVFDGVGEQEYKF